MERRDGLKKEEMVRGNTFWDETDSPVRGTTFAKDNYDVVVAGGGMSGSFAAWILIRAGLRVCLLEAGRLGEQSSSANTGLLQYSSDMPLFEARKKFGRKKGDLFYEASWKGLEQIKSIAKGFPDSVHCIERTSLYYASSRRDQRYIQKEYKALKEAGYPVEYLESEPMRERYGVNRHNGLLTFRDAEINPYAFVQSMLKDAVQRGLVIHENCRWVRHEPGPVVRIDTDKGQLLARHFVIATGYAQREAKKYLKGKVDRVRSYALVTSPIPEQDFWPEDVMLWESARPYLYVRRSQGNRIIIGGLDENTSRLPSLGRIRRRTEELLKELHKLFPHIQTRADRTYGAIFGETRDGMPVIGRLPGEKNCYGLFGYGGNGTVYSSIGAEILRDLILGKENPYAELFRFDR